MVQIFFASHNPGKVREIEVILSEMGVQVFSPASFPDPIFPDVEETGQTFAANAELKARSAATVLQTFANEIEWVLSDDSGMAVDALNGLPGVQSKRFIPGSDHDRNQEVLRRLKDIPAEKRAAKFIAVFCAVNVQTSQAHFFEGILPGVIADEERKGTGFGYDDIFIPAGYTQTLGEVGSKVKNQMSHRALAAQKLRAFLSTQGKL